MDEFKESQDFEKITTERENKSTKLRSNGEPMKENLFTFVSPQLTNDQNSNLIFCLENLQQFESFNQENDFPDDFVEIIHESLDLLQEFLSDLGNSIYSILDIDNYFTLIKILQTPIFSEHCIKLLQSMFFEDKPSDKELEIFSKATNETPLFEILMDFLKNKVFVQNTLTFLTNVFSISSPFRLKFLETEENLGIILALDTSFYLKPKNSRFNSDFEEKNEKDLKKRKLYLLKSILNGPLMEENQEKIILNSSVELSLSLNPIKFHVLLEPLEYLTSLHESKSRDIIMEHHLIDFLTQILETEKESRRFKALKILSNMLLFGENENVLNEMIRFKTQNIVIDIFKRKLGDSLIIEGMNFLSNWLNCCRKFENNEKAFLVIDNLKEIDFLSFLSIGSYVFKRNCIKVLEKIIFFGSYSQNIEIITPALVEKICEIAKESDEEICEQIISIFSSLINSFGEQETDLVLEIAEQIRDHFDLDEIRDIIEGNDEIERKLDVFVEMIESFLPNEE